MRGGAEAEVLRERPVCLFVLFIISRLREREKGERGGEERERERDNKKGSKKAPPTPPFFHSPSCRFLKAE